MDQEQIRSLYRQSSSFSLEIRIEALVNASTLSANALKLLGTLVNSYNTHFIFEFGSGLSTIFLANLLKNNPYSYLYTIDHSFYYLQKTRNAINGNNNVTFFWGPIKLYQFRLKRFATYDNAYLRQIPRGLKFDIVLLDGPPGYRFGREAPLYQIVPFIKPETLIILDDANREPEQEAISNWKRVWSGGIDIIRFPELKKGIAVIQIKNPSRMALFPFSLGQIWRSWQRARQSIYVEKDADESED